MNSTSESSGNRAKKQARSKGDSRAEMITSRSSDQTHEEAFVGISHLEFASLIQFTYVAVRAMMLLLAISFWLRCRSFLTVKGSNGVNGYLEASEDPVLPGVL